MHNKRTIIACLSVCIVGTMILPQTLFAENETEEQATRCNSLAPGSWSIQFQIENDIGLKPFNGKIISLKRHIARKTAFRLGVDLDVRNSDRDDVKNSVYADTNTVTQRSHREDNKQVVQVNALFMNYPNPDANVNLFFGAGPLLRFSRIKSETESSSTQSTSSVVNRYRTTNWNRSWAIGTIWVAGVEWFATRGISFHAEYRVHFDYEKTRSTSEKVTFNEPTRIDKSEGETSMWNFDGVVVTLGLSVYF